MAEERKKKRESGEMKTSASENIGRRKHHQCRGRMKKDEMVMDVMAWRAAKENKPAGINVRG